MDGMIRGMIECNMIPTDPMLLMMRLVSRAWLGVQSDGTLAVPELPVTEITDRSPSITPELDGKPGVPSSGSDRRIPDNFQFSYMDNPLLEYPGVGEQALSEAPGLSSDLDVQPGQILLT